MKAGSSPGIRNDWYLMTPQWWIDAHLEEFLIVEIFVDPERFSGTVYSAF